MSEEKPPSLLFRMLVILGGGALLVAMAADALAVVGRHTGLPLLGSIEIVQAAVLVSASAAALIATLARTHAVVHLLVDRAPERGRAALGRIADLLSAAMFLALMIGSFWLLADLWHGHEESEMLRIPFRPLRLIVVAAAAGVAVAFVFNAFARVRR